MKPLFCFIGLLFVASCSASTEVDYERLFISFANSQYIVDQVALVELPSGAFATSERSGTTVIFHKMRTGRYLALTAKHVVDSFGEMQVIDSSLFLERSNYRIPTKSVSVRCSHPTLDISILEIETDKTLFSVPLSFDDLQIGEEVMVGGGSREIFPIIYTGRVFIKSSSPENLHYVNQPVYQGFSGSGVFQTKTGKVIGVIKGFTVYRVELEDEDGLVPTVERIPCVSAFVPLKTARSFIEDCVAEPLVQ